MADLSRLDNVINELDNQSKEMGEINKILTEISTLNKGLSESIIALKNHNDSFVVVTDAIKNSITESLSELASKVEEFYDLNKKFYKEIDSLLHSLLEKHRSDIQVEIRNESQQLRKDIKEAQDFIEKKLHLIEEIVTQADEKQSKSSGLLFKITLIILAMNVFLALKLIGVF